MSFAELYARHAIASFDKQVYLEAMLGRKRWSFDAQRGTLIFEDAHDQELELAVQVLGTESDEDASWLWAWANPAAGLPARMLAAALELKALGEREAIPELSQAEVAFGPGIDAGAQALAAMLNPQDAVYACLGPPTARYGNDPNFLEHPAFTPRPIAIEDVEDGVDGVPFKPATRKLARLLGYA